MIAIIIIFAHGPHVLVAGSRPLRASSDTNNIFSSDESDDDDDESVTAGTSSANQAAQDRIPHLDSHIGILHLLGNAVIAGSGTLRSDRTLRPIIY